MLPIKRGNTKMIPAKDFLEDLKEGNAPDETSKSDVLKQLQSLLNKLTPEQLETALNMVSDKMDNAPEKEGEENGQEEMQGQGEETIEDKPTMEG